MRFEWAVGVVEGHDNTGSDRQCEFETVVVRTRTSVHEKRQRLDLLSAREVWLADREGITARTRGPMHSAKILTRHVRAKIAKRERIGGGMARTPTNWTQRVEGVDGVSAELDDCRGHRQLATTIEASSEPKKAEGIQSPPLGREKSQSPSLTQGDAVVRRCGFPRPERTNGEANRPSAPPDGQLVERSFHEFSGRGAAVGAQHDVHRDIVADEEHLGQRRSNYALESDHGWMK